MTTVDELTARENVRNLLARNTAWLDGHGVDPATIFAPEMTLHSQRGDVTGIAGVVERIGPHPERGLLFQHFFTDLVIDFDGDRGELQANLLVHAFRPGEAPHNTRGLRATYGFARRGDDWLFTDAGITQLWENGTPLF